MIGSMTQNYMDLLRYCNHHPYKCRDHGILFLQQERAIRQAFRVKELRHCADLLAMTKTVIELLPASSQSDQ